jgi:hypothetical protein
LGAGGHGERLGEQREQAQEASARGAGKLLVHGIPVEGEGRGTESGAWAPETSDDRREDVPDWPDRGKASSFFARWSSAKF